MRDPTAEAIRLMQADIEDSRRLNPPTYKIPNNIADFVTLLNVTRRDKYSLEDRPWLLPILQDNSKEIIICKGRQVGYSVMLSAIMLWHAISNPGTHIIYCSMREAQFRFFSQERLRLMLNGLTIKTEQGENRIKSMKLQNGSLISLMSGSNGFSQSRGYSADVVMLDECEALPMHEKDVIMECLHASPNPRLYAGGTGGIEGSDWESLWLQSDRCSWNDDTQSWQPKNIDAKIRGYHIPQRLSPYWTQRDDDRKKATYDTLTYDTEVLGIHSRSAEIPITLEMIRKCQTSEIIRTDKIYAGMDLAAGGQALSVAVAVCIDEKDVMHVLDIRHSDAPYAADILPVMGGLVDHWQPISAAADAGGSSKELHRDLSALYPVIAKYRMGAPNDPIKYGSTKDDEIMMNRTFFIQRIISRFRKRTITLPDHLEPWQIEHLTAERAVARKSMDRGDYIAYEKQAGRQDDLLMALVFAEAASFTGSDEKNPANRVWYWAIYDEEGNLVSDSDTPHKKSKAEIIEEERWEMLSDKEKFEEKWPGRLDKLRKYGY